MPHGSTVTEQVRVTTCAAVGVLTAVCVSFVAVWQLALLAGWIVTALSLLSWIWAGIHRLDAGGTAEVASREDSSRAVSHLVIIISAVASLAAVVLGLRRAAQGSGAVEVALTLAGLLTVVLSWFVVHTFYVLRYAHLYYSSVPSGGVDFPGDEDPSYRDFAYLGFTVGMTYQVSDTDITTRAMRSAVTAHAMLSFLFGAAIFASTISVLSSLLL